MSKKRRYLITGASGFIGSCLLKHLLAHKEQVYILLRKNSDPWRIKDILPKAHAYFDDLSNEDKLTQLLWKIKPDIIYHLASYGAYSSQNDADRCVQTNITGTWNLLKATANIDYELFVNTGSSSEYGFKKSPMKESDVLEPASYYAATKCSQTLLCSHFAQEQKKPIVTLRPFSVYGPYEDKGRFMPTLLKALFFHKSMNLVSPDTSRDWIYIDDMISAYLLIDILKKYKGEIFNIGTGIQKTIRDVVESAVEVTGREALFKWGKMQPRQWDTNYWVADMSKTKALLKWSPAVDAKQGLLLTWQWFMDHSNLYS